MKYTSELQLAKLLAKEAGVLMHRYFRSEDIGVEIKEDQTPVTIADTKINRLVIERVKEKYPQTGVIGEEDSYNEENDNVWVVDPIDGTMPFSLGIPVSTFSLAYVEKGKVKVAVIYDPFIDRLYWAVEGEGSYLNNEKIAVSKITSLDNAYIALGGGLIKKEFKKLSDNNVRTFDMYSYAFSASLVATGDFVVAVMTYGSPWDAAAASLIVQEAGGRATDLLGNDRNYAEWGDGILITNGHVHDELLKLIDYENTRD